MADIVYGISVAVIAAIVGYFTFKEMWIEMNKNFDEMDEEEEAWHRHRAERQERFDRHAQAVARREVFDQAVNIHFVGEKRG